MDNFLVNPPGGGAWEIIEDRVLTGAGSQTFPISVPGTYLLLFNIEAGQVGMYSGGLRFGDAGGIDAGANYDVAIFQTTSAAGENSSGLMNATYWEIFSLVSVVNRFFGQALFSTEEGNFHDVHGMIDFIRIYDDGVNRAIVGGDYTGDADITQFQVYISAGTITGHMELLRLII
ncbi:hypothetical protein ES703_43348 [subsurface metagenome]